MGQTATDQRPPRVGPGTASVVAAYRRALPRAVRRHLAVLTAPHHADRLRAALRARREQAATEAPGRVVVTVDGRPRIAHLQRALSPVQARRVGVLAVTRALRTAGVPYFAVRGRACGPSVVAVPAAHRRRAGRALARLCRVQPAYVTVVAGPGAGAGAAGEYARLVPGYEPGVWQQLEKADVLRLTWFRTEPGRRVVVGADSGCEVEFWHRDATGDRLRAPRPGRVADSVPAGVTTVRMTDRGSWGCGRLTLRTREEFAHPLPDDVTYAIDAVYTWTDPELRHALRSLATYAPWIRRVHLLTDDGVPPWLDTAHPGLNVVGHREVFADPTALPTVNPRAVESQLHHIDGLAEHFLYFGDRLFLGTETVPEHFFLANGRTRFFVSPEEEPLPHAPHPLRRSVLCEIEREFGDRHTATAAHRLPHRHDLAIPSSLYRHYAAATGRAAAATLRQADVDLAATGADAALRGLLAARDRRVIRVRGSGTPGLLGAFLEAYFPVPSAYELPG
ncbi:stealth conserved region 3 domain-containing protein [Streptomyces sp. WMMC500]|uniref:stealth conserved region 3 domain-containing protein n=1 Tax=Streptomyces sp. WMMC500 TaxID=3015154 RepID=UPI00248D0720|nr:stealth conserved region 3 domain-containing protein [Streptomyces sp. WMMC500]WBB59004.1 stealth conserved region 3 domain-containing protein [Streptomyces sp. WMMC500]